MVVQDRGKMALLAALCTLASVVAGFALGTVAGAESRQVECAAAAPPVPAPPPPQPPQPRGHLHLHRDWLHYGDPGIDIDIDGAGRAWLGVTTQSDGSGAYITQVHPGSPAAAAGLKAGDTITEVDGEQVTTPSQLADAVGDLEPGDKVTVHYLRHQKPFTAEVIVTKRP